MPGVTAEILYTVDDRGIMTVRADYHGAENAPELPCFGIRFLTPVSVDRTSWTGLSGETYPDRYKGGAFGVHEEAPHIVPHLVPQDCGCHYGTHQVKLMQQDGSGRTVGALTMQMADAPFTFSALPNTPLELENAAHIQELPATGRTAVTVLGAVRGVGGINSWGQHPEEKYHLDGAADHALTFKILL